MNFSSSVGSPGDFGGQVGYLFSACELSCDFLVEGEPQAEGEQPMGSHEASALTQVHIPGLNLVQDPFSSSTG